MKILEQKEADRQIVLKVEMDQAEVDASLEESFKRLAKRTSVPGFRRGKAPRTVVERQIGKRTIFDEAMQDLIPRTCSDIIEEQKIDIYARPSIKMTQEEPVTFEASIPLSPVIEIGDYSSLRIEMPPVELPESEVDKVIERIRRQSMSWEVADKPVEADDVATLDVEGTVDGEQYIEQKGTPFQIEAGSGYPVLGFTEELIGMQKGDEKEFDLKFPEDFSDKARLGKEVHFKVKVLEVRKASLPELTDDFVKMISPGTETVDEMRQNIRGYLEQRELERIRVEHEDKVVDALIGLSKLEFPAFLVDNQIEELIEQFYDRVRRSVSRQEEYDRIVAQTSLEKLRKDYREPAIQRVKRNLVISKVVEMEKLETSEEEVDQQIELFLRDAGDKAEKRRTALNSDENRYNIRQWSTARKAIQLLAEKAQTKEQPSDAKTEEGE